MTYSNTLFTNKLWLAPLAGFTDRAFRQLCKARGADVLVSEMVSADGLIRNERRTTQYALFAEEERPFGIQIFGSDPLVFAKAAEKCRQFNPDFIDLNMGCPVKKVVRRGAGSALMREPELAFSIVREVRAALGKDFPVGVKFRSGWSGENLNYLEFGIGLAEAGADFLCLHARTQSQMFSGEANWEHIKILKANVNIPVIGNGDINSPERALEMQAATNCDAVMIGRGILGKPWLFDQIHQLRDSGNYKPVTKSDLIQTLMLHIDLALRYKPEHIVNKELRSQLVYYTKGLVGGAELRQAINKTKSTNEIRELCLNSIVFKI